ncbi:MAG TPA: CorA family divalent cation transporter, partial [Verrucomicrobiota bacterium]|nr:CorA family divalent cation transporter [Verrucomicrobiota bacterium]
KPALEALAFEIAELEDEVIARPNREVLNRILKIKKEVLHLRQIIGPQREVLARFARGEFKLVRAHLVPYYRDVHDAIFMIGERAQGYALLCANTAASSEVVIETLEARGPQDIAAQQITATVRAVTG